MMTLVILIIKSYLLILFSVGIGSLFIFMLGLYVIFHRKNPLNQHKKIDKITNINTIITAEVQDVSDIAGDDLFATQLDLARAYLETGKMQLAKDILEMVVQKGTQTQQMEAQNLLRSL